MIIGRSVYSSKTGTTQLSILLEIKVPFTLFSDLSNPLSFISRLIDWSCVIISSFCSQAKALTLAKKTDDNS